MRADLPHSPAATQGATWFPLPGNFPAKPGQILWQQSPLQTPQETLSTGEKSVHLEEPSAIWLLYQVTHTAKQRSRAQTSQQKRGEHSEHPSIPAQSIAKSCLLPANHLARMRND